MNAKGRCGLRFFAALLTGILATGVTGVGCAGIRTRDRAGDRGQGRAGPDPRGCGGHRRQARAGRGPDKKAPADARYEKHWMFSMGGSNYYPRLKESEAQINSQINGTLGRVIPGWRRPQTFKAWRDNMLLWDLCFGAAGIFPPGSPGWPGPAEPPAPS